MVRIIKGIVLNPQRDFRVNVISNGAIAFESNGKILSVGNFDDVLRKFGDFQLIDFSNKLIMPGLIDLHTHLPQLKVAGIGNGELLEWLKHYVFPIESKFANIEFARASSEMFFDELIRKGTTTAVVFGSSFADACDISFEIAQDRNIRAFIGKTMMDQNVDPRLIKSAKQNIDDSLAIAEKWHQKGKLNFILTPRFSISCSAELLQRTGEIAASNGFFVQTHLAENQSEIETACGMHNGMNYTEIYDKFNLINSKSIFAHCIYLSDSELEIFKASEAIIAHCPSSNIFLKSGIMPLANYLEKGMKIGLGTDVAGGYSLSMLNEAKAAVESANILHIFDRNKATITPATAICLATIKAAEHLLIDDIVGNFEIGKNLDAAVFDLPEYADAEFLSELSEQDFASLALYNIGNYNARAVFIDGERY